MRRRPRKAWALKWIAAVSWAALAVVAFWSYEKRLEASWRCCWAKVQSGWVEFYYFATPIRSAPRIEVGNHRERHTKRFQMRSSYSYRGNFTQFRANVPLWPLVLASALTVGGLWWSARRRITKWGGLAACVLILVLGVASIFRYIYVPFLGSVHTGTAWIHMSDRAYRPLFIMPSSDERPLGSRLQSALKLPKVIGSVHQDTGAHGGYYVLTPLWIPLLLIGFVTWRAWRADRRPPPGHCQKCGYNLTGNVSGRCPECGETTKIKDT